MANISTLGVVYVNNNIIDYNLVPVSYTSGIIELRATSDNIQFVRIVDGRKNILISQKAILTNINYDTLKIQNLISGTSTIVLSDGIKYKIRLITNEEYNKYILNEIGDNNLPTPTTLDKTDGYYNSTNINESVSNNIWNWFNVQTITSTLDGDNIIVRGGSSINKSESVGTNAISSNIAYRLVLEPYTNPPSINMSNGSWGNYTLWFSKKYTVTDIDENDSMTIVEYLDDIEYRTINTVISGTSETISFKDTWDDITAGKHTFKITIIDAYGNSIERNFSFTKVVQDSGVETSTLSRPVIKIPENNVSSLSPKNANTNIEIDFIVAGGDLVTYNELVIYLVDSNGSTIIYQKKVQTYDFYQIIPSGTLINGKDYQLKLRTYNPNSQYSAWSDLVSLKCLSPIELNITNIINNEITTSTPIFTATYNQAEEEKLYSYQYFLYSEEGNLINYSDELTDSALTYQFSDLENKTNYVIKLVVKTENGLETTFSQDFYCIYSQIRLPASITLKNDDSIGAVIFSSDVRQILGEVIYGSNPIYIDNDWLNLHDMILSFNSDGAFRNQGDFTLKLWTKDMENNNMLCKIITDHGYILLTRYNNMFLLRIYLDDILLYEQHYLIKGDILTDDVFYFFIQYDSNYGLLNFDIQRVTEGRTTWFTQQSTNDIAPSYSIENGFLSQLSNKFKNYLIDTNVENQTCKLYLPSKDEIETAEAFNYSAILGIGKVDFMRLNTSQTNQELRTDIIPYFTRTQDTIDNNKLVIVNTDGSYSSEYPNSSNIGSRIIFNVSKNLQVTKCIKQGFHYMLLSSTDKFETQSIGNLIGGDKIKCHSLSYEGKEIEFTVLNRNSDLNYVTLISNSIFINKEYDKEESTHIYGNTDWNTSNIKQFLNSNVKIG